MQMYQLIDTKFYEPQTNRMVDITDIDNLGNYEMSSFIGYHNSCRLLNYQLELKNQLKTRKLLKDDVEIQRLQRIKHELNADFILSHACLSASFDMIDFAITIGADHWNWGLELGARGGHNDVCDMMINRGANNIHNAFAEACYSGSMILINKFLTLGAQTYDGGFAKACYAGNTDVVILMNFDNIDIVWGMIEACHGGYLDLLKLLINKYNEFGNVTHIEWNYLLSKAYASDRNEQDRPHFRREIVDFLVSKGANDFNGLLYLATELNDTELIDFCKTKIRFV
jgi:hypothetical protein